MILENVRIVLMTLTSDASLGSLALSTTQGMNINEWEVRASMLTLSHHRDEHFCKVRPSI